MEGLGVVGFGPVCIAAFLLVIDTRIELASEGRFVVQVLQERVAGARRLNPGGS